MGLNQQLLAIDFYDIKNVEDYPEKICLLNCNSLSPIENGQKVLNCVDIAHFENIKELQGYFEEKYDIKNNEFIQVSNEDINYLINICNRFLQYFSKSFIQEAEDYNRNLSLYEYTKKYKPRYLDDLNKKDTDIIDKINNTFFFDLTERFRVIVNENKECHQIAREILPINGDLTHMDDRLTIYYLSKILIIKTVFEVAKKYLISANNEKLYYHYWY